MREISKEKLLNLLPRFKNKYVSINISSDIIININVKFYYKVNDKCILIVDDCQEEVVRIYVSDLITIEAESSVKSLNIMLATENSAIQINCDF